MGSLLHPGGLSWAELLKRVYHEILDDDVLGLAAQMAYFFLLALFPLLLIVTTALGMMAQTGTEVYGAIQSWVREVVPPSSYDLVMRTLTEIQSGANGGKLSFGIIGTIWAASQGMAAISHGLNEAYTVTEHRPFWKARLVAILLTIGLGVFFIAALVILLYGGHFGRMLAGTAGVAGYWDVFWVVLQWPIVVLLVLWGFAILYRLAPDLEGTTFVRIVPGTVLGAGLWILASSGLRLYLRYFNTYHATYGSLGGVIILLLWFYLTAAAILIGGELNSEIENAAAEEGDPEARRAGERQAPVHR